MNPPTHPTFELQEQRHIPTLAATAYVYRHLRTGARHLHLATEEPELGFLVGFPSLPQADDGRAHILEHTALCGSERYPIRDPFFAMMHRSVATFMNAMTYDDRTVYPFSTTDAADFRNILDVYLDATFFPRLERMDFLQEGWRVELEDDRCTFHGVVLNEMKASYDDPGRVLYYGLRREIFKGTLSSVDSGGDPLCIPSLTHEELLAFHAAHYHPSQAVFMTSGPVDPAMVQACIEEKVMARFDSSASTLLPELAAPWEGTRRATIRVPSPNGADSDEHGLQLAWRFDEPASLDDKMRLTALMQVLAGHDGAPLPEAIRAAGCGRPSQMMDCDTSTRQAVMHVGIAGLQADEIETAHEALMSALHDLARDGLEGEALDAVLKQKRFEQRKQVPGLERLLEVVDAGLRGESLLDAMDQEPALARLAHQLAEPDFVKTEVQKLLACRNHLVVHVLPDENFADARMDAEQATLDQRTAALTPAARQALQEAAEALEAHQLQTPQGFDVLPRMVPSQLSRQPRPLLKASADARGVVKAALPTNGLSQAELVVDVSAFALEEAPWLAVLAQLLPEIGAAGRPAAEALGWREARVQDFSVSLRSSLRADGSLMVELIYAASALREHQDGLAEVLSAWFSQPDLLDLEHLAYLTERGLDERAANLMEQAAEMAKLAMLAPWNSLAAFRSRTAGLASVDFLGLLKTQLYEPEGVEALAAELQRVMALVQAAPRHWVSASMTDDLQALTDQLCAAVPASVGPAGAQAAKGPTPPLEDLGAHLAVVIPSQVNGCFMGWRVPTHGEVDASALAVAAELLSQHFLHASVREQGGAYGVRASYDGYMGVFTMVSYADPRLTDTYADFTQALVDVQNIDVPLEAMENAILGVVKALDRPLLPFDQLRQGWKAWRHGSKEDVRERFRTGVFNCTLSDVRRVAKLYLSPKDSRRAATVGAEEQNLGGLVALDLMQRAQEAGLFEEVSH